MQPGASAPRSRSSFGAKRFTRGEEARPAIRVIDDWPRIGFSEHDPSSRELGIGRFPWSVNPAVAERSEFGNPSPHVRSCRIELFPLKHGVEDPKPRLRIHATTGRPLPSEIVRGPVAVREKAHVVLFATPKV